MEIQALLDHTLLSPEAKEADIERLCNEAKQYGFKSVCVNPFYVPLAAALLQKTEVKICTVIGFPLGAGNSAIKAFEAENVLSLGADELDMVINIGALKNGDDKTVASEIRAVVDVAREKQALVKVILETCYLSEREKIKACLLAKEEGADFVKTSTGFGSAGATLENVRLMRKTVGLDMGVKASGGIKTLNGVRKLIAAGATRIGTSSGVHIMQELKND